jgi:hypothetical protein
MDRLWASIKLWSHSFVVAGTFPPLTPKAGGREASGPLPTLRPWRLAGQEEAPVRAGTSRSLPVGKGY